MFSIDIYYFFFKKKKKKINWGNTFHFGYSLRVLTCEFITDISHGKK